MKDKILFVGGTFDERGGEESKIVNEFSKYLDNVDLYNGGYYEDLNKIIESVINYDIVIWWPNVSNDYLKIRNVKEGNYKVMLVSSKRNIDNKYSFQNLLERAFELKSNLTIEFSNRDDKYYMRLFDPLGNIWYEGFEIDKCCINMINRLILLKKITREATTKSEENIGALAWYFDSFKEEMYKSNLNVNVPYKKEFLDIVKEYANVFASTMFQTKDTKRFLGNASFRCPKGFPSFRNGKYIFVSRRNVNKEFITINDFVPVYYENNKLYYCGDFKPSVDSPIQVTLYSKLKNINFMIHSHCYIKCAPFTKNCMPCGAIEEVDEILNVIKDNYNNNFNKTKYYINLKGHGSIMMASTIDGLENINVIKRNIPEMMF